MKTRSHVRNGVLALMAMSSGLLFAQTWQDLSEPSSPLADILTFAGSGTAMPSIPSAPGGFSFGTGVVRNSNSDSEAVGAWDLEVTGAGGVYVAYVLTTSTRARAAIADGALRFDSVNGGALGSVAGIGVTPSWSAAAEISGSETWSAVNNNYRYVFDLAVNNGVLNLAPGVFPEIGLTIRDGSGQVLFEASDLGAILGIASLSGTSFTNQAVDFVYDPSTGPLQVSWFASELLGVDLLSGSVANILTVQNTSFQAQAVPEIKMSVLMLASFFLAGLSRSRARR